VALRFRDSVYGGIELPEAVEPFVRLPEFVRLRGVGLSNVDSLEFKDFAGPSRWEHGLAVAALAFRCASKRGLGLRETYTLGLAGLLHDVATPPFAHTAEYVLSDFDHEVETQRLLSERVSADNAPGLAVFESELPQFRGACAALSRRLRTKIDPDEVAELIVGNGAHGYLVAGTVDLDNADNVVRAALSLGLDVRRELPQEIADWLAKTDGPPLDLASHPEPCVQEWLRAREELYRAFFDASEMELGRQAFLQHIMRRALDAGLPRRALVWNTEEGFLAAAAACQGFSPPSDDARGPSPNTLAELVRHYRLLTPLHPVFHLAVEDGRTAEALSLPQAVRWIERAFETESLEVSILVIRRRALAEVSQLVSEPAGAILGFKLGSAPAWSQLPTWLQRELPAASSGRTLARGIARVLHGELRVWAEKRPWLAEAPTLGETVTSRLAATTDWHFRLTRNEGIHPYPSTFVHAIPATLIAALGVRGELVLDPFGGTGQTALEAVRAGGRGISNDLSSVATLVARSRLGFLGAAERARLRRLDREGLAAYAAQPIPDFPLRDKWHHPETQAEIAVALGCARSQELKATRDFLTACLSGLLPDLTGRRGKQHGWFADSTPLPRGVEEPPYVPALELFVQRIHRNLDRVERLYASLESPEASAETVLGRATVTQFDARAVLPADLGLEPHEVAAIVTSPPYLGMADYTLGQRLSYYWLSASAELDAEYKNEIGARRRRFNHEVAYETYVADLARFAERCWLLVADGGYVAMVLGASSAKAFKDRDALGAVSEGFRRSGFESIWSGRRRIHWHRNHGYQRLHEEDILVFRRL
jgi:hypothetical protein